MFARRTFRSNRAAFDRTSSMEMGRSSRDWSCQSRWMSRSGSVMVKDRFVKATGQYLLDSVNSRRDIAGRQPRDLGDRRRVDFFEIEKHHLSIDRTKVANQVIQPVECSPAIEPVLFVDRIRDRFEILAGDQTGRTRSRSNHVRRGDVVRHPVQPGPDRTAAVETREAAPQRDMDLLEQIP